MTFGWNKFWQWLHRGQRMLWLEYTALVLAILFPLLLPGYILTLDMVFTPHMAWPSDITSTYPLDVLLWLLQSILPGDVVQKIILFVILLCSGVGMHLLIRPLTASKNQTNFAWQAAAYFAGIFYMINPFTYSRFMAGQWLVLLGYALLPFLVRAFFQLLVKPSWQRAVPVAVWSFIIVTVSLHFIGMVIILAAVFLVASVVEYWHRREVSRRFAGYVVVAGVAVTAACSYWIMPTLFGNGTVGQLAARVDNTQFAAFATNGGALGPLGDVVRLQGFWAEARQLFVLPQAIVPLWGLVVLLVWVLVIIGAVHTWRRYRTVAIVMISSGIMGILLATTPTLQLLSDSLPLFGGYREPHKFVALLTLAYAVLGAFGVIVIVQKWTQHKNLVVAACLALPLVMTPTMFLGFGGQLVPRTYPHEWYAMNDILQKEVRAGDSVVFLPWHMYAPFSFSGGRIIASPAENFFQVSVVQSDDPEFEGVPPNVANPTKQAIGTMIDNPQNVVEVLTRHHLSHVLLAKEQEWKDYDFLNTTSGLRLIYEDEKLKLYEVEGVT